MRERSRLIATFSASRSARHGRILCHRRTRRLCGRSEMRAQNRRGSRASAAASASERLCQRHRRARVVRRMRSERRHDPQAPGAHTWGTSEFYSRILRVTLSPLARAIVRTETLPAIGTSTILKNLERDLHMAKLVFGLNQSLDGYVDHTELARRPRPSVTSSSKCVA